MPYLHLPVQSGSDRILEAMNRGHTTRDAYLRLRSRGCATRETRSSPSPATSSSAFPARRETDFEATHRPRRGRSTYASAFSFKYSRRPGTPGRGHEPARSAEVGQGPSAVGAAPGRAGQRPASATSTRPLDRTRRVLDVLFEKPGRHAGPTHLAAVPICRPSHCEGPDQPRSARSIIPVVISGASGHMSLGRRKGAGDRLSRGVTSEFLPSERGGGARHRRSRVVATPR